MMFKVYTVYDEAAHRSEGLMYTMNDGLALRQMYVMVAKQFKETGYDMSGDLKTYCIGEFDPDDMKLVSCTPRLVNEKVGVENDG